MPAENVGAATEYIALRGGSCSFGGQWRLAEEVAAYLAQAACYQDDRMPLFAAFISANYGLDISPAEALARLRGE